MSFFRNLRSSITRGRSSSRDTTPVCSSLPSSNLSSLNSGSGKRRDSIESRTDSLLNRSDTFVLDDPDENLNHSNCSTLEKKSKKSKVLEKFSTFTKRKKTPSADATTFEHHPSDNATNTYYKWQSDGGSSLDYDLQNDPFNFLYEQQSSLKSLNSGGNSSAGESLKSTNSTSGTFDSRTYRKDKMSNDLKKQLKLLRQPSRDVEANEYNKVKEQVQVQEEEEEEEKEREELKSPQTEADKYKTVTLNSFRKSFREKFLQQQKEAPYNPAWFVEVDPIESSKNKRDFRESSKENRRDLLVFENDNYRPGSRSPIRDLTTRKSLRSTTQSPVKRNETFKIDRQSRIDQLAKPRPKETTPSIRIEFKNSITPHMPGRMVPVGVAKPMPSQINSAQHYYKPEYESYPIKSGTTKTRLNNHSPIRMPWSKAPSPIKTTNRQGRYQTLVQIKSDKPQQPLPITASNSRLSTRIQLRGPVDGEIRSSIISPSSSNKMQPLQQTYVNESLHSPSSHTARIVETPSAISYAANDLRTRSGMTPGFSYKYRTPSSFSTTRTTTTTTATRSTTSLTPSRTTPTHSTTNISRSSNNLSHLRHQQQQQPRIMVTAQRRSRSPIKIPWR